HGSCSPFLMCRLTPHQTHTFQGKLQHSVRISKSTLCLTDPSASATKGTQLTAATCGGKGQTWSTITAGALPAGQTQTFTYDAEGRTATVSTPSGTTDRTSKYLYDADGNLLEQTSSTGGADKTRIDGGAIRLLSHRLRPERLSAQARSQPLMASLSCWPGLEESRESGVRVLTDPSAVATKAWAAAVRG
ncbi:hypothetical protein ACWCQN_16505, partial [Streptomyces sp. NPDC001984]